MRYALPLLLILPSVPFTQQPKRELPRVLLLGDAIREGYAPLVTKRLEGVAEVIAPKENGGDTANTLKLLDKWLDEIKPLVVHFNCGLHDLKFAKKTNAFQVPIEVDVVDRLIVRDNLGSRLADSLETALRLADGVVQVEVVDDSNRGDTNKEDGLSSSTGRTNASSTGRPDASSTGRPDATRTGGSGGSRRGPPV